MSRKDTSIAFYYRVAETLKGRIASHRYGPGAILPSENTLAREFAVSNITIRKAMALLVENGWVVRRRGIGTQVANRRDDRIPLKITGNFSDWVDSAVNRRLGLAVEVLGISMVPCPFDIARRMDVESGAPVWEMRRLRKQKGNPVSFYINYALPKQVHGVTKKDVAKKPFIDVFQEKTGLTIHRIARQVEAGVADLDTGALLGVDFGAPLFFVTHTYFSPENAPIMVTKMVFRGDRYIYSGDIFLDQSKPKAG
jgi:GntR family transcriptional regulator